MNVATPIDAEINPAEADPAVTGLGNESGVSVRRNDCFWLI
jgi:hypothetical protein